MITIFKIYQIILDIFYSILLDELCIYTLPFKSLGSVRFVFKEMYIFTQPVYINYIIKIDRKDMHNVIKYLYFK